MAEKKPKPKDPRAPMGSAERAIRDTGAQKNRKKDLMKELEKEWKGL